MTIPWLAFIESNTSGTGRLFARAAKENGCRPILLTTDASRYRYAGEEGLAVLKVDTSNSRALLEACCPLKAEKLAGITTASEYYIARAASLARRLRLPGPSPLAVRACRDKRAMRVRLQGACVGVPRFRQAQSAQGAVAAAREIGYPVVVKPPAETGSIGVRMCANDDEAAAHATGLLARRQNERGLPMPRRVLIEELVVGPEYSVETFGETIIGITEKHLGALPNFVEIGHDFPAVLPDELESQVHTSVRCAQKALGLDWGPAHFELRLSSGGPRIIEVNPRLAGGYIPLLVKFATGIDLVDESVRVAVGLSVRLDACRSKFASIRFILAPRAGELSGIEGTASARAIAGVCDVQVYRKLGERIELQGDFHDRIGHVISQGNSATLARASADEALSRIRVVLKEQALVAAGVA